MKILLITHYWHDNSHHSNSSGYERLAQYLSLLHDVDILTPGKKNSTIGLANGASLITRRVPDTNFFFEKRLFLSFNSLRLSKKYDIVHALYSDVGLFPSYKFPTVITEHVLKELDNSCWMRYKHFLQKITYLRVKLVIVVSSNLKSVLVEHYGLRNKVVMIPHGIDVVSFYPIKPSGTLTHYKMQLLKNHKYLCFSCGVQGIDSSTFLTIAKQFPQILFVVAGRKENTRLSNVYQTGRISENALIQYYAIADFCFKPLKFATANNAILEAMAMGRVTITNKIDGVTDYLDETCAYLASSVSDFPKLFEQVMNNRSEVEKRGQKAREKAEKEFSWEVIVPKIIRVYQQVLKDNKR